MARSFLTAINLNKNELQNAAVQNLGTAPSSPVKGQLYYNSTGGDDTLYWWNGTVWKSATGSVLTPAVSVTTSAVGDAGTVGASTNYARQDHAHGREAFGAVAAETTFGSASGNGAAATLARSDHVHGNPTHNNAAHSAINLSALAAPTVDTSWGGFRLTTLATPTAGSDAVTKDYADNLAAGLSWKDACRIGTTANIAALTGLAAIDGVTPIANDRILVKNQTTASQNGIYLAASGAWTRALDANTGPELEQFAVFVMEGTTLADTAWVCTTNAPITVDTTGLTIVQFGGGGAPTGSAGGGLTGSYPNPTLAANAVTTATITAGNVTNATLANMGASTVKGSVAGGVPADLTTAQHTTLVDVFTSTLKGAAPASAGGTTNYLRADATWAAPVGTVQRFSALVGGSTSAVVGHGFNQRNTIVSVFRTASPYDEIDCDIEHTDFNSVTLRFATAPAASEYTCVVIG